VNALLMRFEVAATLLVFAQATNPSESLLQLAQTNDPALRRVVREQPGDARLALNQAIGAALSAATSREKSDHMTTARRLADAFATEWLDPFSRAQIGRAAAMSPTEARSKLLADSLRREGGRVLMSDGIPAAMKIWRRSVAFAKSAGDSASLAASLGNMGAGFLRAGAADSAIHYLTRARAVSRAVGDRWVEANALGALAAAAKIRGDFPSARTLTVQSLSLRGQIGDFRGEAADYNNIGLLNEAINDRASARKAYMRSLTIARERGFPAAAAISLNNLGNLAVMTAAYDDAARYYGESVLLHRRVSNRLDEARVLHNWGLLELRRGNPTAAQRHLLEALARYPATERGTVREDLTTAYILAGDPMAALRQLEAAERSISTADPLTIASIARTRADLAMEFNRHDEARREYGRAETLSLRYGDSAGSAAAAKGRGVLLNLEGDNTAAARLLERVTESELGAGDATQAAFTRLLAASALANSDSALARVRVGESLRAFYRLRDTIGQAVALGQLADLDVRSGDVRAAQRGYTRALDLLARRDLPVFTWTIRAELGRNLLYSGESGVAVRELRRAVKDIERLTSGVVFAARRSDFLTDKWEPYGDLVVAERRVGDDAAAFEVSERMRARQLLDALSRAPEKGGQAPAADTLVTREKQLRRAIEWLSGEAERKRNRLDSTVRRESLTGRDASVALERAKAEYASLLDELTERAPSYAEGIRARALGWKEVAERLDPHEALVEYMITDSVSVAFVVTGESLRVLELPIGRKSLAGTIELTRAMLDRLPAPKDAEVWRAPLTRLHDLLIRPLLNARALDGVSSLVIIPHADLHYLPFAALVDRTDGRFLVDRYDLSYSPSASVWARRTGRALIARQRGILAVAPRGRLLIGANQEIAAIQRIYGPAARVLRNRDATQSHFRAIASNFDMIHIATTGVLDSRHPLFSYLNLDPDQNDGGRLFVHEIFGLNLPARLVVLSACETALGAGKRSAVPTGDEWVSLVRAFFQAGAQTVVATLWQVDDRATARLMESFYQDLEQNSSPRRALSVAQRAVSRRPVTAHPYFWAAFTFNEQRR
jgi:CHAT domain-containing protein